MSIGLSGLNNSNLEKENKDIHYKYSKNPFTPKGKMSRLYYFIYVTLIGFISRLYDTYITVNSLHEKTNFLFLILFIYLIISTFQLFLIKKRILDITNNNKKSWICASLFVGIATILGMINQYLVCILVPFGLYILLKESYKDKYTADFETNTITCEHCGRMVKKAKFCSKCGGQLSEMQEM